MKAFANALDVVPMAGELGTGLGTKLQTLTDSYWFTMYNYSLP